MSNQRRKAISLFSGAGGDTLGMKMAGIDVVGYVEFDKDAIATHKHNFPECELIGEDITKITDKKFEEYKNIDIIFGGFPCQSFSHGGKKNPTDSRGFLYQHFVRAVGIIKPKIIIGENVKGLLTRITEEGDLFIDRITQEFNDIGYNMKTCLFNMKDFNIPQDRKRVLIYGIKKDLPFSLTLDNVKCEERKFNRDILSFSLEKAKLIKKIEIYNLIPVEKYISNMKNHSYPTDCPPTNLIKCYNSHELSFKTRSKSTYSCVIDLDDVSRTILSTYGRMPRLFVPIKNSIGSFLRPYTIKELQQIQGFPKSFIFKGNYTSQVKQIGNAIPPLFISYISTYIIQIMNEDIVEYIIS